MRKQVMEDAAYEVATQVRAVEDSIEAALIEIAELQAKMVHARAATKAGFVNTHAAFEQLAVASSSLIAARGGIAHATKRSRNRRSRSPACAPSASATSATARRRKPTTGCASSRNGF